MVEQRHRDAARRLFLENGRRDHPVGTQTVEFWAVCVADGERLRDDETLGSQIDRLADFIMRDVPGEPAENEGAIDTAIRIMRRGNIERAALDVATMFVPAENRAAFTEHIEKMLKEG